LLSSFVIFPNIASMELPFPDIQTYYDRTRFDYRMMWNRGRPEVAVHFGYYDTQVGRHTEALDNLNRVLADLAGIRPGERVLDAGCGMGSACFWLAEHRQAEVTGVNVVPQQIADCQRNIKMSQFPNLSFVQADYCRTPFAAQSFDVVWACESLCHAAEKRAFYSEAFRLLKPGGRIVAAEYMRQARPLTPGQEQVLASWLRPWAIPDIDTAKEHVLHARAAGFSAVDILDVTPNMRVSLRNLREISRRWLPAGRLLHRLGLIDSVRLGNARASVRQYEALEKEAWFYGLLRADKPT
jgi:ubiquinone/menaquinone biosynthesis C-methylase UbiE